MFGKDENKNSSDDSDGNDISFELINSQLDERNRLLIKDEEIFIKHEKYAKNKLHNKFSSNVIPSNYDIKNPTKREDKYRFYFNLSSVPIWELFYKKFIQNTIKPYPSLLEMDIRINYVLRSSELENFVLPQQHSLLKNEELGHKNNQSFHFRLRKLIDRFNKYSSKRNYTRVNTNDVNIVKFNIDKNNNMQNIKKTKFDISNNFHHRSKTIFINNHSQNSNSNFSKGLNLSRNRHVSLIRHSPENENLKKNCWLSNLNKSEEKTEVNEIEHVARSAQIKKNDQLFESIGEKMVLDPLEKISLYNIINRNLAYSIENEKLNNKSINEKKKFSIN